MKGTHSTPYTTHPDSSKMYQDLHTSYLWDGMKKDIAEFVQKYQVCQQVKGEHQRASGLLVPLPIPEWKWSHNHGLCHRASSNTLLSDFLEHLKD